MNTWEKRIGFLTRVSGHTFDTLYDLIFTSQRVIAVIVSHPSDEPFRFGFKELFFGSRRNKWESLRAERPAEERLHAYEDLSLEELLNRHRFSFQIPYHQVVQAEVSEGRFQKRLNFHLSGPTAPGRVVRFTLQKSQVEEARRLLSLVFSS